MRDVLMEINLSNGEKIKILEDLTSALIGKYGEVKYAMGITEVLRILKDEVEKQ